MKINKSVLKYIMKVRKKRMHEQSKKGSFRNHDRQYWLVVYVQICTSFVHALSREVEHQENLASSPAPGVKLD